MPRRGYRCRCDFFPRPCAALVPAVPNPPSADSHLPALLQWTYAFVDERDDRDMVATKVALTFLSVSTTVAAILWGLMYLIIHRDLVSFFFCVLFSICVGVSLVHFAVTKRTTAASLVFVGGICAVPAVMLVLRGGVINSGAVVLWSSLSPPSALLLLRSPFTARFLLCLLNFFLILFFSLQVLFSGTTLVRVPPSHPEPYSEAATPLVHAWFVMNVVGTVTLFYFAMEHFWLRWRTERMRSQRLLMAVFPLDVMKRLSNSDDGRYSMRHNKVAVCFIDLVGFTEWAARTPAAEMVKAMSEFFAFVDASAAFFGVEKIKNIGDAVMVISGRLPRPSREEVAKREPPPLLISPTSDLAVLRELLLDPYASIALFALHIQSALNSLSFGNTTFSCRAGISVGPVIAGVIGSSSGGHFDVFGNTVNLSARLESRASAASLLTSLDFAKLIDHLPGIDVNEAGGIAVKGIAGKVQVADVAFGKPPARFSQASLAEILASTAAAVASSPPASAKTAILTGKEALKA